MIYTIDVKYIKIVYWKIGRMGSIIPATFFVRKEINNVINQSVYF